jgi:hypothetical protein
MRAKQVGLRSLGKLVAVSILIGDLAFSLSYAASPRPISAPGTAVQQQPQPQGNPYITITRAPNPDTMIYEDHWNAFRFEYPSFLKIDDLGLDFRNDDDSNVISLHTEFSSTDPKDYDGLRKYWPSVSFSKENINGMPWVKYSATEGTGYYLYREYQEVAIEGVVEGNPRKPLSPAELTAMRQIVSTFQFTPESSRVDFRIAAVNVGAQYRNLRVSRVITRATANGDHQKYWSNPAGEVDFSGAMTLSGYIDNRQTMNSGPAWTLSGIEPGDCAKLPQIAYPVDCSQLTNLQISLTNAEFIQQQFAKRTSSDDELTVEIDDLAEVYYGSGLPSLSAKLVRIEDPKSTK